MTGLQRSLLVLAMVPSLCLFGQRPLTHAAIVTSGNVEPADPAAWADLTTAYIGKTAEGSMAVDLGSHALSVYGYLGDSAGSNGTVTVTGAGSTWTNSWDLFAGNYGIGTLNIEAGGEVSNKTGRLGYRPGSSGTVTVTGAGSKWTNGSTLYVGDYGIGTLNIVAGGEVSSNICYFGHNTGSSGTATVSGAGSRWTNSDSLYVGNAGSGKLIVSDGGLVTAKSLYASLSDLAGNGTIAVRGAVLDADLVFDATHGLQQTIAFGTGGTLNLNVDRTAALGAGYKGSGTLRIANGVTVRTTYGYLGHNTGSSGMATVTGAGSTWTNSDSLYVGHAGSGRLTVSDGGLVTAETLYASLSDLAGNGTITVRGAVLDADLVFDATHGLQQTIAFGTGGTLNLNVDRTALGAGYKGNGTLRIADGVTVVSFDGRLGSSTGSIGTATVTNATWINGPLFYVGYSGSGALNVTAGGQVSSGIGHLALNSGSSGTATVTGAGSTWTNGNALNVGGAGSGSLNIEAGGQVSNSDGRLGRYTGSSGTATVTGAGSKWTNSETLYVGMSGTGTLNIAAGGEVRSSYGYVANDPGSIGTATVRGTGSKWTASDALYVGIFGRGSLSIEAGGEVFNTHGYLGYYTGSSGTATVIGAGSMWTNRGTLYVGGYSGQGLLMLADGGEVTASSVWINSRSRLAIDVANGSRLTVDNGTDTVTNKGTGTVTNKGTIRLLAGPRAIAGVSYTPISARVYDGSGGYQGVGGVWSMTSHTFTPSIIETGLAGMPVSIDLASRQRMEISDATTGWVLGASFLAKSAALTVTTRAISDATRTNLEEIIAADASLVSGWQFTTNSGYMHGEPVYLSFDVGGDYSRPDFSVWRYFNTRWTSYEAVDLTYDGQYASFTVTDLNIAGYAVTAVPEPSAVAILAMGLAALGGVAWRCKRLGSGVAAALASKRAAAR